MGDKKRILCIEDEPEMIELMRLILERKGFRVTGAVGGVEGLDILKTEKPDLILLDLMMPGMNGGQFLDELDKRKDWRSIPVIALTAVDLHDSSIHAIKNRVEKVIQKGAYSIDSVLSEVRGIMNGDET